MFDMKKHRVNERSISLAQFGMRKWMRDRLLTYRSLAELMDQSPSNVWKKVNGKMAWQSSDLRFFHDKYGLSSDFVLGLDGEADGADSRLGVA